MTARYCSGRLIARGAALLSALALGACAAQPGEDYGLDSKKLSSMQAVIWVDPTGCEHWVIDDGVEGYMVARRSRDGKPSCPGGRRAGGVSKAATSTREAVIWRDPNGCEHWVYDDGGEGFMSERLNRDGTQVCAGRVSVTPTAPITLAADALFDTGSAVLRPEASKELTDFGRKMQRLGKRRVYIVGHTDSRASDRYNQGLSERRAATVASYLEKNFGIVGQTDGKGESDPVADNTTPEGRQSNRRVVISVLD